MNDDRTCSRCVLTEHTPGISFDEAGVCSYCRTYESKLNVLGEDKLIELLNAQKEKNQGRKFDCMVGVSGGRDSTYTLYKLVRDYGMRVLGIHYDNPFQSEQAVRNMQRASEILKVEILRWSHKEAATLRGTKKALRLWSRRPSAPLIPLVCLSCKAAFPIQLKHARKNGVSLYVIGSNPLETASFKSEEFGGARTYHKLSNIPRIIKKSLGEIAHNPGYLGLSWKLVLLTYLGASHSSPYMRARYGDIKVIRLFDYIKWNEKEVESLIARELDWKKSPEVESSWRFDCRLDYVKRKMYASTVGVTELRDLFSKMTREGLMTREEALERLKREDHVPTSVADDVLRPLDLKLEDLNLGGRF
jgi:hypothetical protein